MASGREALALLGGRPAFSEPVPVGQLNFPEWPRIERSFRGIFQRRYYTNQGPLAEQFEAELAAQLEVEHAICMTNATIALMIAAVALELKGKVATPAYSFIATAQSLLWAGLEPVFCDVDPHTHQLSAEGLAACSEGDVAAILAVHLWGHPCDVAALQAVADRWRVPLYFDAAQAFGARYQGRNIGCFGELEVFSFHATKILGTMEGGCVTTNDDHLAARLRNIRSSYGSGPAVPIPYTGNGRFSEGQAAMGLLALEDFPRILKRNEDYQAHYRGRLAELPGIVFPRVAENAQSNCQYVVMEVDQDEFGISRDQLVKVLEAENILCRRYFTPGIHRCTPFSERFPQYADALPVTDHLCASVMQVPSGQPVSRQGIDLICDRIKRAHEDAEAISKLLDLSKPAS